MFEILEKRIIVKLKAIETKKETINESGVARMLNNMRQIDQPCYEELMNRYKQVIQKIGA